MLNNIYIAMLYTVRKLRSPEAQKAHRRGTRPCIRVNSSGTHANHLKVHTDQGSDILLEQVRTYHKDFCDWIFFEDGRLEHYPFQYTSRIVFFSVNITTSSGK